MVEKLLLMYSYTLLCGYLEHLLLMLVFLISLKYTVGGQKKVRLASYQNLKGINKVNY